MGLFNFLFGKGKSGARPKKGLKRINVEKRFELSGRTGQGSMSKVCRAYDRELGRNVCLKLLDKEKTPKFEERFVGLKKPREGEICMALRHENIVRTYEYGITTKGEPYLVMEWVEGLGLNYLDRDAEPAAQRQPDQLPRASCATPSSTCTTTSTCTATCARGTSWWTRRAWSS